MIDEYSNVYPYPWETVVEGVFDRHEDLPSKLYPELLTTFYHDTAWDEDRTVFSFIRNTIIEIDIPKWVKLLINIGNITNTSKCTIDRQNKILQINSENNSYSNYVVLRDIGIWKADPENPNQTIHQLTLDIEIVSLPFPVLRSSVVSMAKSKYIETISRILKLDHEKIEKRFKHGTKNQTLIEKCEQMKEEKAFLLFGEKSNREILELVSNLNGKEIKLENSLEQMRLEC